MTFDGKTYDETKDGERLGTQLERVAGLMKDGRWRTLGEIRSVTGGSEASVSARLRDLRKQKFGAWTVNRRRRGEPILGLFEYQLQDPAPTGQQEMWSNIEVWD